MIYIINLYNLLKVFARCKYNVKRFRVWLMCENVYFGYERPIDVFLKDPQRFDYKLAQLLRK